MYFLVPLIQETHVKSLQMLIWGHAYALVICHEKVPGNAISLGCCTMHYTMHYIMHYTLHCTEHHFISYQMILVFHSRHQARLDQRKLNQHLLFPFFLLPLTVNIRKQICKYHFFNHTTFTHCVPLNMAVGQRQLGSVSGISGSEQPSIEFQVASETLAWLYFYCLWAHGK